MRASTATITMPNVNAFYDLELGHIGGGIYKTDDDRVDDCKPLFFLYKMYIYIKRQHIYIHLYIFIDSPPRGDIYIRAVDVWMIAPCGANK